MGNTDSNVGDEKHSHNGGTTPCNPRSRRNRRRNGNSNDMTTDPVMVQPEVQPVQPRRGGRRGRNRHARSKRRNNSEAVEYDYDWIVEHTDVQGMECDVQDQVDAYYSERRRRQNKHKPRGGRGATNLASSEINKTSASSSKVGNQIELDDLFDCPVCLDTFEIPVMQCSSGHSFCDKCLKNCTECPLCRISMTLKIRNYTLENLLNSRNQKKQGITVNATISTVGSIEFRCPGHIRGIWACPWIGTNANMAAHFRSAHPDNVVRCNFTRTYILNFNQSSNDVHFIIRGNGEDYLYPMLFIQCIDSENEMIYWACRTAAPYRTIRSYFYKMEFVNIVGNASRKLEIQDVFSNMKGPDSDLFRSGRCLSFSFAEARKYFHYGEELTFNCSISYVPHVDN